MRQKTRKVVLVELPGTKKTELTLMVLSGKRTHKRYNTGHIYNKGIDLVSELAIYHHIVRWVSVTRFTIPCYDGNCKSMVMAATQRHTSHSLIATNIFAAAILNLRDHSARLSRSIIMGYHYNRNPMDSLGV